MLNFSVPATYEIKSDGTIGKKDQTSKIIIPYLFIFSLIKSIFLGYFFLKNNQIQENLKNNKSL